MPFDTRYYARAPTVSESYVRRKRLSVYQRRIQSRTKILKAVFWGKIPFPLSSLTN